MAPPRTIEAVEQRTLSVTVADYRDLESSPSVHELIAAGVIMLQRSKLVPYAVRGGAFVGQAIIGENLRLVVREKSPGALQSLLHWSVPEDLREAAIPAPVARSHGGPVLEVFARHFLSDLAEYLRRGRLKEYRFERVGTGRPRGRIDVPGTARLRARGSAGRVVHRRSVLTADVLPNRLLAFALESIDSCFRLEGRFADVLDRARFFAPVFEDVDRLHFGRRDWAARADAFATAFADAGVGGELRRALAYARAVVLHLGPWFEENWEQGPPTSFFLNLQTLFEDAVRQIVNEECAERVTKGVELKRPLLEELPGRYLVDPDVVVSAPGAIRLVMDCKYKDVEGLPAQPDVYQLSAHATALDCGRALLVYPGSDVAVRILGITRNGLEVRWATVRVHDLRKDLRTVLAECGVPLRAQPAGE